MFSCLCKPLLTFRAWKVLPTQWVCAFQCFQIIEFLVALFTRVWFLSCMCSSLLETHWILCNIVILMKKYPSFFIILVGFTQPFEKKCALNWVCTKPGFYYIKQLVTQKWCTKLSECTKSECTKPGEDCISILACCFLWLTLYHVV